MSTEKINYVVDVGNQISSEQDRIDDIEIIDPPNERPISSPFYFIAYNDTRQTGPANWISAYAGRGIDFEVLLIMAIPILFGQLFRYLRRYFYPQLRFPEYIKEHPLIPLTYLQQTKDELRVTREKRNDLDWLGTKFLLRASDSFVDLTVISPEENTLTYFR
jgi:hypothetical protein